MKMNAQAEFLRIGNMLVNLNSIAYVKLIDSGIRLFLNTVDGNGKPVSVALPKPYDADVLDLLLMRTILDIQPVKLPPRA